MKLIRKIFKVLGLLLLSAVLLIAAADAAWIYVPQIKAAGKSGDVDAYARSTGDITVPGSPEIIALGEASHGNADFQTLRLTVLRQLVENNGVRAFALEADFSEAMIVDRYILGGEGTAEDAVSALSFTIYHTVQMAELVQWMREYNDAAPEDGKLSFYGFDMQNPLSGLRLLSEFCAENSVLDDQDAADKLAALAADGADFSALCESSAFGIVHAVRDELADNSAQYENGSDRARILRAADCILQAAALTQAHAGDDYIKYNNIRDGFMAENVQWILEHEQSLGHAAIMISGHDGHVAAKAPYYTPMGAQLKTQYADKYFIIGTDYFRTVCNINSSDGSGRGDHSFCSADPLAAQAKRLGGSYYLSFAGVPADSETYSTLHSPMTMGSLGEGYSFLMKLIPTSHRVQDVPAELYDAMIFVYKASPIDLLA